MDTQAVLLLKKQLKELSRSPVDGFSAGLVDDSNIFERYMRAAFSMLSCRFLRTILISPQSAALPRTCGILMCSMTAASASRFYIAQGMIPMGTSRHRSAGPRFTRDDPNGEGQASKRPVHTVETIMISIISMLSSPNDESPANVDAAKEWREDREGFRKHVARIVRKSQESL
eukprot:gene6905-30882_t